MSQAGARGLTSSEYYDAAQSRLEDAIRLYEQLRYVAALFVAGCSIECMLWAFIDPHEAVGMRGIHDLRRLFDVGLGRSINSRFSTDSRSGAALSQKGLKDAVRAKETHGRLLTEATVLWGNHLRYYPDSRAEGGVRKWVQTRKEIKGDLLKAASNEMNSTAGKFFTIGENEWRLLQHK
jgi:hypothetical protein